MFSIEPRSYGYKIVMSGQLSLEEMQSWLTELRTALDFAPKEPSILVDARELEILDAALLVPLEEGFGLLRAKGALRADVVTNDPQVASQFEAVSRVPTLTVQEG